MSDYLQVGPLLDPMPEGAVVEKVYLELENGSQIIFDRNAKPPIGASTRPIMAFDTPIKFELDDQASAALAKVNDDMRALSLWVLDKACREGKYGYWGTQFAKFYAKAHSGTLTARQKVRFRMAYRNCLELDLKRMYANYAPNSRVAPNGYIHVAPKELDPPKIDVWERYRGF